MNWKNVLNGLGVLLLVFMAYLIWEDRNGQVLAFLAGGLCLVVANTDVIEELHLSLTGFRAKTRKVIQEAEDTTTALRLISKDFSRLFVTLLYGEGRIGGATDEDLEAYENTLLKNLKDIGLGDDDLEDVRREARPFVLFDYARAITWQLQVPDDRCVEWEEFYSADRRKGFGFEPSPDELEAFLDSMDNLTDEIRARIEDYRYYQEHTRHRRPDEWARHSEWNNPIG